jgi:hypothetical protein
MEEKKNIVIVIVIVIFLSLQGVWGRLFFLWDCSADLRHEASVIQPRTQTMAADLQDPFEIGLRGASYNSLHSLPATVAGA